MDTNWAKVAGVIIRGHQVASQKSEHYPLGAIEMQIPFFKARGLDLTTYFRGTLNISISPRVFRMVKPQHTFRNVEWTTKHPPEDFSFSRCRIEFKGELYDAWVYYPHPETKERHFQNPSVIEVIAPQIQDISYGAHVEVVLNTGEVLVENEHND
jgi:hypothetical protein